MGGFAAGGVKPTGLHPRHRPAIHGECRASGAHRVDTVKLSALLELPSLDRADPAYVRAATGQPIGGVAPIGHPRQLRTVVDIALAAYPVVWAAAGTPDTVFNTSYAELLRLTAGTPAEVA